VHGFAVGSYINHISAKCLNARPFSSFPQALSRIRYINFILVFELKGIVQPFELGGVAIGSFNPQ
jgi:hypothetical protein